MLRGSGPDADRRHRRVRRRGAHRPGTDARSGSASSCGGSCASGRDGGRWCCRSSWRFERALSCRLGFGPVATRQRGRRRRPVRRRPDLAHRARQLRRRTIPAWFFSTGIARHRRPTSSAASARSSPSCRSSCSATPRILIPALIAVVGWHYFWCRPVDAAYTKLTGAGLLFACASAFLSVALGRVDVGPRAFRAGGYVGEWLGGLMSEYLNRTGSVIVLLALIAGAVILATQFSFGALFAMLFAGIGRAARAGRRRRPRVARGAPQGQAAPRGDGEARQDRGAGAREGRAKAAGAERPAPITPKPPPSRREGRATRTTTSRARAPTPPVVQKKAPPRLPSTQPLPLPEPDRSPAERRMGGFTLPPLSLLDAPKAERKIDERELMERRALLEEKCREFAVEGTVVQIHPGPGRHDLRVQARRRREVQRRSPASPTTSASRCRPSRCSSIASPASPPSASRFRTRTASRSRCASCSSRTPTALDLEADARARQDDPRRAVRRRPGDDAAPAHCRLDRHRQVGRR